MADYSRIDTMVRATVLSNPKKIAICPFAEDGMLAKQILNQRYGIEETYIVDNRLAEINEGIKGLVSMFKPDAIAVEELFFNNNITTGIQVAEARGVIICTGVQTCGNLFEYTPIQIKQAITGTGKADKKQVQYMTKMLLNLKKDPKPDDAADALAVALTHAQTNNSLKSNSMFDIQKRVYHKDQKKNLGLIENLKKDKK